MYSLHLKYLSTMADMAVACSQAYTSAMTAHLDAAAKAMATASDAAEPASNEDTSPPDFAFPEMPRPGQSWYRAPYENPFLAFWDDMLRPWRTFATSTWLGAPTIAPSHTPDAIQAAFAFAPWLQQWGDLVTHAANHAANHTASAMSAPADLPGSRTAQAPATPPVPFPFMQVAQAKIRFPDDTEVTISIPYLPVTFAGAAFLKNSR